MKGCEGYGLRVGKARRSAARPQARALGHSFGWFLAAAWLSLNTGCGLVAYPQRTQLPPASYCSVYVRDAASHELLTNATVRFEAVKEKHWMNQPGPLRAKRESTNNGARRPAVELPGQQTAPGCFVFQPIHKTEWAHVYFPFGAAQGGILYNQYAGSLLVDCPGHVPVCVQGAPEKLSLMEKKHYRDLVDYDGQLTIFLPPKTP